MPLYEYTCLACGHDFELLVFGSSPAPVCSACSSPSIERRLSMFAVSSAATQQASRASAYAHNNKLNARQEPDKARIQIEHRHQH